MPATPASPASPRRKTDPTAPTSDTSKGKAAAPISIEEINSDEEADRQASETPSQAQDDALHWHIIHAAEFQDALSMKAAGNEHFQGNQIKAAIELYTNALSLLPIREEEQEDRKETQDGPKEAEEDADAAYAPLPLAREVRDLRAQLHANIGTCHYKQERWKDSVKSCTLALNDDSAYVKALLRRAAANEKVNSWSSLSAALEDWKTLYQLPDLPPSQTSQAKAALARLPPLVDKRREAETAEVLGKLKDLGNSFLGKFGLSTDNFKMTPNGAGGPSDEKNVTGI